MKKTVFGIVSIGFIILCYIFVIKWLLSSGGDGEWLTTLATLITGGALWGIIYLINKLIEKSHEKKGNHGWFETVEIALWDRLYSVEVSVVPDREAVKNPDSYEMGYEQFKQIIADKRTEIEQLLKKHFFDTNHISEEQVLHSMFELRTLLVMEKEKKYALLGVALQHDFIEGFSLVIGINSDIEIKEICLDDEES